MTCFHKSNFRKFISLIELSNCQDLERDIYTGHIDKVVVKYLLMLFDPISEKAGMDLRH